MAFHPAQETPAAIDAANAAQDLLTKHNRALLDGVHQEIDLEGLTGLAALAGGSSQAVADARAEALRAACVAHGAGVGTAYVDGEHKAADTANNATLSAIAATNGTLGKLITLVNGLHAWDVAHATSAGVHFHDDAAEAADTITTDPPTTLAHCVTDLNDIRQSLLNHFSVGQADTIALIGVTGDGSVLNVDGLVQVGVLASDAQHGNRGGGGIHANAVAAGAAGFMTGADKTKIDGIESGATKITGGFWDIGDNDVSKPTEGGNPAWADLAGATFDIAGNGTSMLIDFYVSGQSASFNNLVRFRIMVDGVVVGPAPAGGIGFYANAGLALAPAHMAVLVTGLAAGARTVKVQWIDAYGVGTATIAAHTNNAYGQGAQLSAIRF